MTVQPDISLTWSEPQIVGFLMQQRLICTVEFATHYSVLQQCLKIALLQLHTHEIYLHIFQGMDVGNLTMHGGGKKFTAVLAPYSKPF